MPELGALRDRLREYESLVVAFSGGAASAFLAWVARDTLGADRVVAATAVSPSLAADELDDCRALAGEWGLRFVEVVTTEIANDAYVANDGDRCYWCKSSLMDALTPQDRKSTRLNSSHLGISYAVFCLKKKNTIFPSSTILRQSYAITIVS